jgi:hypothetical protein
MAQAFQSDAFDSAFENGLFAQTYDLTGTLTGTATTSCAIFLTLDAAGSFSGTGTLDGFITVTPTITPTPETSLTSGRLTLTAGSRGTRLSTTGRGSDRLHLHSSGKTRLGLG